MTLGSTGVDLQGSPVSAAGEKLNSKYKLEECTDHGGQLENGHYFTYQVVLNYEGSRASRSTTGALQLNVDVYSSVDYSTTPISQSFSLPYTASF